MAKKIGGLTTDVGTAPDQLEGPGNLPAPHGGELVGLLAEPQRVQELQELSKNWPSWTLTPRQMCDIELLMNGGFSPLCGFMSRTDYESVCRDMRLSDGTLWPIPIVLDVPGELLRHEVGPEKVEPGSMLALRDAGSTIIAAMHVEEIWQPDREEEAQLVYGTQEAEHPGVAHLINETHTWYVGGKIEGIQLPKHYDFYDLRHTPAQLREQFERLGWSRIIAFQTRDPMHRAQQEMTMRAAREIGGNLLIHPAVGLTNPGDVDHYTRVRCYQKLLTYYPLNSVMLSLLPLAVRMAGPREALWHAIIRKNCGCTHFIVGRDYAGPGADSAGRSFYEPYEGQELLERHQEELKMATVPFTTMVYLQEKGEYVPVAEVPQGTRGRTLSHTQLRELLAAGADIPPWFSFPEVVDELRRTHPPRISQGFTVLFTGLPSSGKSTLANVLMVKLLEAGGRAVTLLDGDILREDRSSTLDSSKEHCDAHIRRVGCMASEICKNGGIAICADIAPFDAARREVREMIEPAGAFILVHVATPVDVCESRDPKGLYARARAGTVEGGTGVYEPYEEPDDADVRVDTSEPPEVCVEEILAYLEEHGHISRAAKKPVIAG